MTKRNKNVGYVDFKAIEEMTPETNPMRWTKEQYIDVYLTMINHKILSNQPITPVESKMWTEYNHEWLYGQTQEE